MWVCNKCERIFEKQNQPHSCRKFPIEKHFINKEKAKNIFDQLFLKINESVGNSKTISLPCCIHLYGEYDYLAALPKKDRLEVRFALNRVLDSPELKQSVPLSSKSFKNCIDICSIEDINNELIGWIKEAYYLKK